MARYIGIIGYPLKHSISPVFQQAGLDYYKLDISYQAWEVEPGQLGSRITRLRRPEYLGANVTVPYKEQVLPLIDELDEIARRIGAVNTIVNRDGRLVGYNTDAGGFLRALQQDGGFDPRGKRVVMLGAGGVARAAGFVLVRAGIGSLAITQSRRAEKLASDLNSLVPEPVAFPSEGQQLKVELARCDLILNCTPVGMRHSPTEGQSPLNVEMVPGNALVYDLVYNPVDTPLLAGARKRGARALGGLSMLVYQGAASFELWLGRAAPLEAMFQAARKALEG